MRSALEWEPGVDAGAIGVTVDRGIVTLHGQVSTFAEMEAAECVALRIDGVSAVANEIDLKLEWDNSVPDGSATSAVFDLVGMRGQVDGTVTVIP
jgi:hypothetical protein